MRRFWPIPEWKIKLLMLGIFAVAIAAMYLLQFGCFYLTTVGVVCPGCGMTRAVLTLLKGDVAGALKYHAMVWSLPLILMIILYDGRVFRRRWMNIALIALISAGFLANWIWKLITSPAGIV